MSIFPERLAVYVTSKCNDVGKTFSDVKIEQFNPPSLTDLTPSLVDTHESVSLLFVGVSRGLFLENRRTSWANVYLLIYGLSGSFIKTCSFSSRRLDNVSKSSNGILLANCSILFASELEIVSPSLLSTNNDSSERSPEAGERIKSSSIIQREVKEQQKGQWKNFFVSCSECKRDGDRKGHEFNIFCLTRFFDAHF